MGRRIVHIVLMRIGSCLLDLVSRDVEIGSQAFKHRHGDIPVSGKAVGGEFAEIRSIPDMELGSKEVDAVLYSEFHRHLFLPALRKAFFKGEDVRHADARLCFAGRGRLFPPAVKTGGEVESRCLPPRQPGIHRE